MEIRQLKRSVFSHKQPFQEFKMPWEDILIFQKAEISKNVNFNEFSVRRVLIEVAAY